MGRIIIAGAMAVQDADAQDHLTSARFFFDLLTLALSGGLGREGI
jgi:hypothetical protein